MRQVSSRISPQSLMRQLKSQVKTIGAGTKFCMLYWAVPKASWPSGLPPAAADALVPEDQLVDMELQGGATVDSEAYYIVDQVVPREVLGKGVQSLEIYVMNSTRLALPATAQGKPAGAAGSGGGDGGGALEALTDTAHGARRQRGLKRDLSSASEPEDPEVKTNKQWMSTLTTLRDEIVIALQQDQWYPTHRLQHSNVKDLIGELLEVLRGMPGDTAVLYTKIGRWLEKEFQGRPMYGVLHHFQGLFANLVQGGADERGASVRSSTPWQP